MRICKAHWQLMRDAVDARGMAGLVHSDGTAAMENEVKALDGGQPDFDPLMSMNWHWSGEAMRCGGLYLMTIDAAANPDNEGHYCPVCEFQKHSEGFVAPDAIGSVADQMQAHCYETGLIPRPS